MVGRDGRLRRAAPVALAALLSGVAAAVGSCVPSYEFSGADGGSDARTADGPGPTPGIDGGDGGPSGNGDAPSPPPPLTQAMLLRSATFATETGNAQQQHLVYAKNSGRWWFFYIDSDGLSIHTEWSLDFSTWTAGAPLTPLPLHLGGDARNFSVAYKDFSGTDVIHLATSLHDEPKRVLYDTRATISGATITFGTPVMVHDLDDVGMADAGPQGGSYCDPDGTGVAIAGDGHVYIATSWVSIPGCCSCDSNFATSTGLDTGSSWTGGFVSPLTHFTVPGSTHARQIIGMSTGAALGAWETADEEPFDPSNVSSAGNNGGTWPGDGMYPIFPTPPSSGGENLNDWSVCRIDDDHVHAVRRKLDVPDGGDGGPSQAFEHYFLGGNSWAYEGALSNDLGLEGTGVVLLTNGSSLLAATIAADGNYTVRYATFDGTSWSGWSSLTTTTAERAFLSGSGCGDPAHPALVWTEGTVAPFSVVGVQVESLFP